MIPWLLGDTTITVVGNLTADPELRFTPSGAAVANFTVASTPHLRPSERGVEGTARPCSCAATSGREAAENVAEPDRRGASSSPAGSSWRSFRDPRG